MKKEKTILISGLFFSILLFVFTADDVISLTSGKLEFALIEFSLARTANHTISTAIIGYLLFYIFISEFAKKAKNINKELIISFYILTLTGFLFELYNIIESFAGYPHGRQLHMGLLIGVFGFYLLHLHSANTKKSEN